MPSTCALSLPQKDQNKEGGRDRCVVWVDVMRSCLIFTLLPKYVVNSCLLPSHSRLVVPPSPRRSGRCCCRVYGLQGQAEKGQAGRAEAKRVPRTQFRDQVSFMRQQHTKSSKRPHLLSSLHSSLALPSITTLTLTLLPTSLASTWLLLYTLMCGWIDTSG